jgi:two-component system, OmpR family, response regulator
VRNAPRVLIADDEVRLAEALRQGLSKRGYDITVAHDGNTALKLAKAGGFDLILLDLMLPGLSGYRVIESLRSANIHTPILMLTAKDGEYDEADALELGADDYVTKPFSTVVLLARMKVLLRRSQDQSPILDLGELKLEPGKHLCTVNEQEINLTRREYELLEYLAERPNRVIGKQELLDEVWDEPNLDQNAVEVCVVQVRKKLGKPLIKTIRGVGYQLVGTT